MKRLGGCGLGLLALVLAARCGSGGAHVNASGADGMGAADAPRDGSTGHEGGTDGPDAAGSGDRESVDAEGGVDGRAEIETNAGTDGGQGSDSGDDSACTADDDCAIRAGACVAKNAAPSSTPVCDAGCTTAPPSCVCENGHCTSGTLEVGALCDPQRSLCGDAFCCQSCSNAPAADGGAQCAPPTCIRPLPVGGVLMCPVPA